MNGESAGMKEDKAKMHGLGHNEGHNTQEEKNPMQKLDKHMHDAQAIGDGGHSISDPAQLLTVGKDEKLLDPAMGQKWKPPQANEPGGRGHVAHMPQLSGKNASQRSGKCTSGSDAKAAAVSVMSAQEDAMPLEVSNESPAEQCAAKNEADVKEAQGGFRDADGQGLNAQACGEGAALICLAPHHQLNGSAPR